MPAIWIIGLVTFCNYVFTLSLYYFTPTAPRFWHERHLRGDSGGL